MANSNGKSKRSKQEVRLKCGLVMPISAIDGCTEQHWNEVNSILSEAILSAGFEPLLVSDADDVGIIQKRIITNLYENPIVVCDVSGKNPNVMFELGMRLAFDKPTIIVKDDKTPYSFDTAPIEHLEYPRDLRFQSIVSFKDALSKKVSGTHEKAVEDSGYTTFLKHFGTFNVAQLESTDISKEDYLLEEFRELRRVVLRRDSQSVQRVRRTPPAKIVQEMMRRTVARVLENLDIAAYAEAESQMEEIIRRAYMELDASKLCDGPDEFATLVKNAVEGELLPF